MDKIASSVPVPESVVTFVVIAYGEKDEFHVSLGSLLCQRDKGWKAIVYHDGPSEETRAIVEGFKDNRITYIEAVENTGTWGVYNRIKSLDIVDTEYVIQCTAQEYYAPIVVGSIRANMDSDIIIWNTAHHHFQYQTLDAQLRVKKIDWSNFALRTEIAKQVGINHPTNFCADGLFIEDCVKSKLLKKGIKISKVLSIKN